jgi:hypothetical protein
MMAELSPPGFDNMVRTLPQIQTERAHLTRFDLAFVPKKPVVLRLIRTLEPRIVDDRPECDSGGHQQYGQQLGRLPLLVRSLRLRESGHLVRRGRPKGAAGRCEVGGAAAWGRTGATHSDGTDGDSFGSTHTRKP